MTDGNGSRETATVDSASPGSSVRVRDTLDGFVSEWNPIYFALIMATGIVSIAAWSLGLHPVALGLFGFNVVAYVVVCVFTLAKVGRDPRSARRDLVSHDRALGSFSAIAGTCVLGSQFLVLDVSVAAGAGLFVVGGSLWVVLIYVVFAGLTVQQVDKPIEETLDGSWLLAVVATQSVAVLAGLLAPFYESLAGSLLLVSLVMYSTGGLLYLILIPLIFYRLIFFPVEPRSMTSPYWINAGAVAITTLAGAILVAAGTHWGFLENIRQFIVGFTFFYWVAATWWIPLLVALGIWRHTVGGIALPHTAEGYDVRYWAMVFPLGMYAASTYQLVEVTSLDLLAFVPRYFVYVALFSWLVVAVGLLRQSLTRVTGGDKP